MTLFSRHQWLLRCEEFIWYLFLVSLPFQTRIILWQQDWQFNEWRSAFFYGTDILFLGLLLFWMLQKYQRPATNDQRHTKLKQYLLFGFLAIAAISVLQYENKLLGGYQFLRLFQAVLFFWYVRGYAVGRFKLLGSLWAMVAGGVFQSIIAIAQFLRQSDLGLRLLGESILSPTMQGVAVFYNFAGEKIMRVYGTLPHPNLLAAYLLVAMFAVYLIAFRKEPPKRIMHYVLCITYGIILFGFLLTFARTTIFVGVVAIIIFLILNTKYVILDAEQCRIGKKLLILTSTVMIIFAIFFWQEVLARMLISSNEEAVQLRLLFNKEAFSFGGGGWNINWFGVGIGNFVSWFIENRPGLNPHLYQPVHNVYLLVYSELGIFGLLAFLGFIGNILSSNFRLKQKTPFNISHLTLVICLLFIALFDHFPWTIQQGRLMFWGVLALL